MRLFYQVPGLQQGSIQEVDSMPLYQIFLKFSGIKKRFTSHTVISTVWVKNFNMGEAERETEKKRREGITEKTRSISKENRLGLGKAGFA